jgi:hypothetical protein
MQLVGRLNLLGRNLILTLSFGRMVHFRRPPDLENGGVCFLSGRRLRRFLRPARDGGLVTPFEQAVHYLAMDSGENVGLHRRFRIPQCSRPENVSVFSQHRNTKISGSGLGLSRRTNGLHKAMMAGSAKI